MRRPLAVVLGHLPRSIHALIVASTALLTAEHLGVVAAAVTLPRSTAVALAISLGCSVLHLARGWLRIAARSATEASCHLLAADALLDGDLLSAEPARTRDSRVALLDAAQQASRAAAELVPSAIGDALAGLVIGAYLVLTQPTRWVVLGLLALAAVGLAVTLTRHTTERLSRRAWEAYAPVVDGLAAAVEARAEIVANGEREAFRERFRIAVAESRRATLSFDRFQAVGARAPLLAGAVVAVVALLVGLGAELQWQDLQLSALLRAAPILASYPALSGVAQATLALTKTHASLAPLAALLETTPGTSSPPTTTEAPSLPASVEWSRVTFRYPGAVAQARPALRNVSLSWAGRRPLVLTGLNGSGKSTALRLLVGIGTPQEGLVRVGHVDLNGVDRSDWQKRVAYLPQRPFFAARESVGESVRLVASSAGPDDIRAALERVGMWDALKARDRAPLEVPVAELSAGERQRVALARVMMRNASLVLLDEPDANLDARGVELVCSLVRELVDNGKMVAVIAHTRAVVEGVQGEIVELRGGD